MRFSCVALRSVPIRHDTSDVRHDASAVRRDPSAARQPCGAMRLDPFRYVFDAAQCVTTRMEGVGFVYGYLQLYFLVFGLQVFLWVSQWDKISLFGTT